LLFLLLGEKVRMRAGVKTQNKLVETTVLTPALSSKEREKRSAPY
jgi:hypothetical protein